MPDIEEILRDDPDNLSWLLELSESEPPIEPDLTAVYERIKDQLVWETDKKGYRVKPKQLASNVQVIMENDPEFAYKVWLNDFSKILMLDKEPYSDIHSTQIRIKIFAMYGFEPPKSLIDEVVMNIGNTFIKNPLQDWLNSMRYELGTDPIEDLAIKGFGCEPTKLNKTLVKKWLIQAVARAMVPGCQADATLIMVGRQGVGKSTGFKALASSEYFCDTPMEIGNKDTYLQMQRAWIYEVAELDSFRRREVDQIKAFLTPTEDTFRPPYQRFQVTIKRHTVFCGTTNRQEIFLDPTGNRRFWTITVKSVDVKWIRENRNKIWAQAVYLFKTGEPYWFTDAESSLLEDLESETLRFLKTDSWCDIIDQWARMQPEGTFSLTSILLNCLKIEKSHISRMHEQRASDALTSLGYEKVRSRQKGSRVYMWRKPADVIPMSPLPLFGNDNGEEDNGVDSEDFPLGTSNTKNT